jgi:hypothetical protein
MCAVHALSACHVPPPISRLISVGVLSSNMRLRAVNMFCMHARILLSKAPISGGGGGGGGPLMDIYAKRLFSSFSLQFMTICFLTLEVWGINLTKDSSLLLPAIRSLSTGRKSDSTLALKIHLKKSAKQENLSLFVNSFF